MTTSYKKKRRNKYILPRVAVGPEELKTVGISGLLDSSDDMLSLDPGFWVGGSF